MPVIELETHIHAERNICFDLARSIDFHMLSTADTNEKAIAGCTTGLIGLNEFVTWEAKHLGITQHLTSRITQFETNKHFRDEQIKGPFKKIVHDHRFIRDNEFVIMRDNFEFEAPLGWLGKFFCKIYLTGYLRRLLTVRNQMMKEYLETGKWKMVLDHHSYSSN